RAARLRPARAPRRRAAAHGACGRRAPLWLRPGLRGDRCGARIERNRSAAGRLCRHSQTTREGIPMNAVSTELDRRFRDAAAQGHLLDAAYDFVDPPVGPLFVAATERGLCRVVYDAEPEQERERLARAFGIRVLRSAKPIAPARRELDEYFDG